LTLALSGTQRRWDVTVCNLVQPLPSSQIALSRPTGCKSNWVRLRQFNLMAFNDFVLNQGLLPPKLLKQAVMNEFVPAQLAKPD
jgi:hypothetical protein